MRYDNEACNEFVRDMVEAGYEVEHYRGRFSWEGPSINCERSDLQDVIRATSVHLQSDALGKGLVVYPITRGTLVDEPEANDARRRAAREAT